MAAKGLRILVAGFLLLAPVFALANTYGTSTYGTGQYNIGFVAPVATSSTDIGGGGLIVGSGPNAPGYQKTPQEAEGLASTTTTTSGQTSGTSSGLTGVQIQSILSILSAFGVDSATIETVSSILNGTATPASAGSAAFGRDLEAGDTGEDVRALQQYLNAHGFQLANSGPGSPGNETTFFGDATQYQLIQFQKADGITPAAGYFGPITRAFVESH